MAVGCTKVIQITNIAPQATKDQMQALFGYLGKIEDIRLYPTIRDVLCPVQSRICYVKFTESTAVTIAQHMTNTVFIDRALIVIPIQSGEIPDEYYALEMTRNGTIVTGVNENERKLPPHVTSSKQSIDCEDVIVTTDAELEANGLLPYPALPTSYTSLKVEECRRSVLVNIGSSSTTTTELIDFFTNAAGEVKYMRQCEVNHDNRHFIIEFTEQGSVIKALKLNGKQLIDASIEVHHATQAIIKPQAKSNEAAQKEIEEAMARFKEAQNMINATIEPVIGLLTKDKRSTRRSRSRSRSRHRHRSRSRSRGSRSHRSKRSSSRSRRSRSRDRRKRSKSRSRKHSRSRSRGSRSRHSRSRSRKRSKHRSRDRDSKSKARSRSRERKRKSNSSKEKTSIRDSKGRDVGSGESGSEKRRSKSRSRSKRRSRSRDRKRDKDRRRSRSRGRKRSSSPRGSRKRSRSKSHERRKEKKDRKRDRSRSRSKNRKHYDDVDKSSDKEKRDGDGTIIDKESSEKSDNMDISNSP